MLNWKRLPLALGIAAGIGSGAGISAPAGAQNYPCPSGPGPGEVQIGTSPGGNGIAPVPLCESAERATAPRPEPDVRQQMDAMSATANRAASELARLTEELKRLNADPRAQRYLKGEWHFYQGGQNAKPGEYCNALWTKRGEMVIISGPGPKYHTVALSFIGPNIPRPQKSSLVRATLKQPGAAPQTVRVVNSTPSANGYGMVSLSSPSTEAALEGLEDTTRMELVMQGKVVATAEWSDGLMAKRKLRQCMAGRAVK